MEYVMAFIFIVLAKILIDILRVMRKENNV